MNTILKPVHKMCRVDVYHVVAVMLVLMAIGSVLIFVMQAPFTMPPSLLGYRFFRVIGSSMEPTFSSGAVLMVKEIPVQRIQLNDVITYYCSRSDVALTTHRVKQVHEVGSGCVQFTTRGDGNPVNDPVLISGCEVVGKVMYVIKPSVILTAGLLLNVNRHAWFFTIVMLAVFLFHIERRHGRQCVDQLIL